MSLKPCPCGDVPKTLRIQRIDVDGEKPVYQVTGDCCGAWIVERRSGAMYPRRRATSWWNAAPRGKK